MVAGMAACLAKVAGPQARLLGFKDGTKGLFRNEVIEIGEAEAAWYLNAGGMQMLGRSADVVRTEAQLAQTEESCRALGLDGLVLVGGPVSASDTAALAERFAEREVPTASPCNPKC